MRDKNYWQCYNAIQYRQRILTFLITKVGMVKYRHATTYHLTKETIKAFEQRQERKEERVRVVVPCDWNDDDDDDDDAVFLKEKEAKWVVVVFVAAADADAPAPANGHDNGCCLRLLSFIFNTYNCCEYLKYNSNKVV